MTVINSNATNYLGNGYYQLGSQQNSATPAASTTLAAALQAAEQPSGFSSAYQLNLSSDASDYLSGLLSGNSGGATSTDLTAAASTAPSNFTLSPTEQNQLATIIEKYKDAPQTQAFNQIQDDLKKAELDPDSLAAKAQVKNFNATSILIGFLSGTTNPDNSLADPSTASSQYDAAKSNYLQKIQTMWQNISTTGTAATDTVSGAASDDGAAATAGA